MPNIKRFTDLNGNSTPFQGVQKVDTAIIGSDSSVTPSTISYSATTGFEITVDTEFTLNDAGMTVLLRKVSNTTITYPSGADIKFNINNTGVITAYKDSTKLTSSNFELKNDRMYLLTLRKIQGASDAEYRWNVYEIPADYSGGGGGGSTMSKTGYSVPVANWTQSGTVYTQTVTLTTQLDTSYPPNVYVKFTSGYDETENNNFGCLIDASLTSSTALLLTAETLPSANFSIYVEGLNA